MWPLLFIIWKKHRFVPGSTSYRGLVRVFGYCVALALGFSVLSMHSARGEVAKSSMRVGRSLMPLAHMLDRQALIDIDGEQVSMGIGLSDESLGSILDKFENHCRENGVTGTWDPRSGGQGKRDEKLVPDLGVIRSSTESEGVVLCFIKTESTADTLLERLSQFEKTRDLGALGRARYVYAQAEGAKTSILTLWTDDHLRLDRMVPSDTFEPGSDNPQLPRPYQSRRILSGSIEGLPYAVRGYVSTASPREVLDRYDAEMQAGGWKGLEHPAEAPARGYAKDGVIVFATAAEHEGKTSVSLAEMGGQDPVRIGVSAARPVSIIEK